MSSWITSNYTPSHDSLPDNTSSFDHFSISTPPRTDIWRPDEDKDVWTAPILYQRLASARTFHRARVTVHAAWKTQYDQGGLVLFWPTSSSSSSSSSSSLTRGEKQRWIKAGIEFFNGVPWVGVVGCDRFSDWSLSPVPVSQAGDHDDETRGTEKVVKLRLEMERVETTLWIYALNEANERVQALREVKWAFLEDRDAGELGVGVYSAKPTPEQEDQNAELMVHFDKWELETK